MTATTITRLRIALPQGSLLSIDLPGSALQASSAPLRAAAKMKGSMVSKLLAFAFTAILGCSAVGQDAGQTSGPRGSGVYVNHPIGPGVVTVPTLGGPFTVVIEPPVYPGGPGHVPENQGESNGWNGSSGALPGETLDPLNPITDSEDWAKLQTLTVRMKKPPGEQHWELIAQPKVGGNVSAHVENAAGSAYAAAYSKTKAVYGNQAPVAVDSAGKGVASPGNSLINTTITIAGFGGGLTLPFLLAGTSAATASLGDQDTGLQARANRVTVDYTQKGEYQYTIQVPGSSGAAKADCSAEAKGSVVITAVLVAGL